MAEKTEERKQKKGFFYFLGCVFKAIYSVLKVVVIVIAKVLGATGLYLPLLYALTGLILYVATGFNPLDFDGMTLECTLYAIGLGLCVVFALVITVKNFIIKPLKRFGQGFSEFGAKKEEPKEKEAFDIPKQEVEEPKRQVSPEPIVFQKPVPTGERVKVYYSGMQDRLIREYDDRFEVFVTKDGIERLEKVEYKLNEK